MDETSWQLALLKANINITNIDITNRLVYFDFAYRPSPGKPRVWGKSVVKVSTVNGANIAVELKDKVLALRKELE